MPTPQPDTATAVTLSGADTVSSRFGIEGQSVLGWPGLVKSRLSSLDVVKPSRRGLAFDRSSG